MVTLKTRTVTMMTINICRLIRDFPSLRGIERVSALDARGKEIEYVEYGLAPGVYTLMKEQVSLGAHMDVITVRRKNLTYHETVDGIEVHRVKRPYNITTMLKMKKLDKAAGIDIVHAHATSGISYALLRRFMKRKPYVIHIHGTTAGIANAFKTQPIVAREETLRQKFWIQVSLTRQKLMWKKADLLIAVSNNIADELKKLYLVSSQKIRVVHNGVDIDVFKPVSEESMYNARKKLGIQGNPIILNVGRLSPVKGLRYLLEAAPKVIEKFPKALFVLLGSTPKFVKSRNYLQVWSELATKLGISRNVLFAGQVQHRDTLDFYAAADVFAFPSLYEGLSKALLEAMACGLPVVATNVGGNPDAVVQEETGLLIEPHNVGELANALIRVLSDFSLARNMGLKARERVKKHFTWKSAAKEIGAIYEQLLRQ